MTELTNEGWDSIMLVALKAVVWACKYSIPEIANAGGFDVVTLWSVLAHLPRPVDDFKTIRGLLKPGGVLLVLTVNANSLQLKASMDDWGGFTPNHLKIFSPSTLSLLFERAGFGTVEFRPMYPDGIEAGMSGFNGDHEGSSRSDGPEGPERSRRADKSPE